MDFTSASTSRAQSQHPSHLRSSVPPQQLLSGHHHDILRPNFGETHLEDGPQHSVTQPYQDSFFVFNSRFPRDADQNVNVGPYVSHDSFTFTPTVNQARDLDGSDTTLHLHDVPLPRASSAVDATAIRGAAYAPPYTYIIPPGVPSAGPSQFENNQLTFSRHDGTAPPRIARTVLAPAPAPPPSTALPPVDPRATYLPPPVPAVPAPVLDFSEIDVARWSRVAESDSTPSHVPPAQPPRKRRRRHLRSRSPPLVRIEDQVEWVRPNVLKVTMWLNWSPNADGMAHLPWDEPPRVPSQ